MRSTTTTYQARQYRKLPPTNILQNQTVTRKIKIVRNVNVATIFFSIRGVFAFLLLAYLYSKILVFHFVIVTLRQLKIHFCYLYPEYQPITLKWPPW